jgi:hypothetical protein
MQESKRNRAVPVVFLIVVIFVSLLCGSFLLNQSQTKNPLILEADNQAYTFTVPGGDRVFIGDPKASKFYPEVQLSRWNQECSLKLTFICEENIKDIKLETNMLTCSASNIGFRFYPLNPSEQNELGGLEYELILNQKPSNNVLTFNVATENLQFYYQPELTEEEIRQGCVQPDNVVGSYAVYHNSKTGNIYTTGKAFHIYRPQLVDTDGRKEWAMLNLSENGFLTITLPQTFLDEAIYPVTVDPTIGYTTIGASSNCLYGAIGNDHNHIRSSAWTTTEAGTATSITVALKVSYLETISAQVGFYKHINNVALLASKTQNVATTTSFQWFTFTLTSTNLMADMGYLFCVASTTQVGAGEGSTYVAYDSGATNQGHWKRGASTLPSNFVVYDWLHENNRYSIYCTYTAVANNPPNTPTLSNPANSSRFNLSASASFSWSFIDPDAGYQSAYQFQLADNPGFSSPIINPGKTASTGWLYRKSHVINAATGAGTNYPIKICVSRDSLTDSGDTVYVGTRCKTDFGDIRFTSADGVTQLDYWMESNAASGSDAATGTFWVRIPEDLSTASRTIYLYYGNSAATTTSNGAATFAFFDDFDVDKSKWTGNTDKMSLSGSVMTLTTSHSAETWYMMFGGSLSITPDTGGGSGSSSAGSSGNLACTWGILVYRVLPGGGTVQITSGTPVAQVTRSVDGAGYQSNTWSCPQTTLVRTDRIRIDVYVQLGSTGWRPQSYFVTSQLDSNKLSASTWTVYLYTRRSYSGSMTTAYFTYGGGYNNRAENVVWSAFEDSPPTGTAAITGNVNVSPPYALRARIQLPEIFSAAGGVIALRSPTSTDRCDFLKNYDNTPTWFKQIRCFTSGTPTTADTNIEHYSYWRTFEIKWTTTSTVFLQDDVAVTGSPLTSNIPTVNLAAYLKSINSYQLSSDWILLRKYVNPEPAHGVWGSEEFLGSTTQILPAAARTYYWRIKTWDNKDAASEWSTSITLLVDQIKLATCGIVINTVDVNTGGKVWYQAVYEADSTPFTGTSGTLYLNGDLMNWTANGWTYDFPYSMSGSQAVFQITSVADTNYGLTAINNAAGNVVLNWATMGITISKP